MLQRWPICSGWTGLVRLKLCLVLRSPLCLLALFGFFPGSRSPCCSLLLLHQCCCHCKAIKSKDPGGGRGRGNLSLYAKDGTHATWLSPGKLCCSFPAQISASSPSCVSFSGGNPSLLAAAGEGSAAARRESRWPGRFCPGSGLAAATEICDCTLPVSNHDEVHATALSGSLTLNTFRSSSGPAWSQLAEGLSRVSFSAPCAETAELPGPLSRAPCTAAADAPVGDAGAPGLPGACRLADASIAAGADAEAWNACTSIASCAGCMACPCRSEVCRLSSSPAAHHQSCRDV